MNSIKLSNRVNTIFISSENSKTSDLHRLLLKLSDKINLKSIDENMLLYQILLCTIHGKIIKKSYKNSTFRISAPNWNEKFELPDGSYYVSVIQDCFEYFIKKYQTVTDICK